MRAEQGGTIWIKQVSVKNGNSVKKKIKKILENRLLFFTGES